MTTSTTKKIDFITDSCFIDTYSGEVFFDNRFGSDSPFLWPAMEIINANRYVQNLSDEGNIFIIPETLNWHPTAYSNWLLFYDERRVEKTRRGKVVEVWEPDEMYLLYINHAVGTTHEGYVQLVMFHHPDLYELTLRQRIKWANKHIKNRFPDWP